MLQSRQQRKKQTAFGNADKLKAQATAAAMKKPYNVFDFYWEIGVAQRIARDKKFDNLTMFLVAVNAIYIAVDLDLNHEDLLMNAHPIFIMFENFFCLYFATETLIRFSAFQHKVKAFKDAWFLFDFCLVNVMVIETWLIPLVVAAANIKAGIPAGFLSILRMLRLGRLLRLTRLTRLARSIPELSIIMKGLSFASRSVFMFFVLWMVIIYVFAIVFSQLTEGDINKRLFPTVPDSINTLLLHGVFGSQATVMREISDSNPVVLWPMIVFFFALVSVTIMYMLIGVMNECIAVVAATEKSKIEVSYIVGNLREEVERLGYKEEDMRISQSDMQTLILEPGIIKVMQEAGVDVLVFADMLEMVFEEFSFAGQRELKFEDLINLVLSTRGQNPATVKDCKEAVKVTKQIVKHSMEELQGFMSKKFRILRAEISALGSDDEEEDE